MSPQHIGPLEAVQIHQELRSKHSIGMHWGTFILSNEPVMSPKQYLDAYALGLDFRTVEIGDVVVIDKSQFRSSEEQMVSYNACKDERESVIQALLKRDLLAPVVVDKKGKLSDWLKSSIWLK